ncbi:MAG: chemotactic signal-response protein chel [Actinobacteria bacterium]|nr:chemotactic signal-response protein chel [Actinomycetota bacterium]
MANLIDIGAAHQAYGNPTKLPNTQAIESKKQARKIADDFEAVFLSQMLKPMFEGIKPEAPFGGGNSEAMWRSMQIEEYGKAITKAGGIGIADTVFREIIKLQEIN